MAVNNRRCNHCKKSIHYYSTHHFVEVVEVQFSSFCFHQETTVVVAAVSAVAVAVVVVVVAVVVQVFS